jgi:hypothetical protein
MKLLLLLFFTITLPVVVLLTAVLYGGISSQVIKTELSQAHVYPQLDDYLGQLLQNLPSDQQTQTLVGIVEHRLHSDYLQKKTESTLDTSANWITGKTTARPTLSFKEVRDDIAAQDPELITTLQNDAKALQQQAHASTEINSQEKQLADVFSSLVNSDFSLPLDKQLQPVKTTYTTLRIVHPVLLILSLLSLVGLVLLNKTWRARLNWFGAACLTGGLFGVCVLLLCNSMNLVALTQMIAQTNNQVLAAILPIGIHILTHAITTYLTYQRFTSIGLISIAVLCFLASGIIKSRTVVPTKDAKKK